MRYSSQQCKAELSTGENLKLIEEAQAIASGVKSKHASPPLAWGW